MELNKKEKEGQQNVANQIIKHIQICEILYNQDLLTPSTRDITSVGNMGETMCKYKNKFKVHIFFENAHSRPQKKGRTESHGKKSLSFTNYAEEMIC